MDRINSRISPGPDGVHPGISREPEDEADEWWVINSCLKLYCYLKTNNVVSSNN